MAISRTGLEKLILVPERTSYQYRNSSGIVTTEVEGGLSRSRIDTVNGSSVVGCGFRLGPEEYRYLLAFYNSAGGRGSRYFLIDLILDRPELEEYIVKFVPDSLSMSDPSALNYEVSLQLEVLPNNQDDYDFWVAKSYQDYTGANSLLNALETFANTTLDIT